MPITSELENARRLKAVGFSEAQAETRAEIVERSQQKGFDRFTEVLERGLSEFRLEMKAEFAAIRAEIAGVRAELHSSLRDQMLKFITILVSVVGIAVAIIKLFPKWY